LAKLYGVEFVSGKNFLDSNSNGEYGVVVLLYGLTLGLKSMMSLTLPRKKLQVIP
jgi:hypothetical protein